MSETKIKIPEGMLEAAAMELSDVGFRSDVIAYDVKRMLEAALLWLSENPIVPTDAFLEKMLNQDFFGGDNWTDPQVFSFCAKWQRHMFLAPETEVNPAVRRVRDALTGCTLTAGDAVELMDAVRMCVKPEPSK